MLPTSEHHKRRRKLPPSLSVSYLNFGIHFIEIQESVFDVQGNTRTGFYSYKPYIDWSILDLWRGFYQRNRRRGFYASLFHVALICPYYLLVSVFLRLFHHRNPPPVSSVVKATLQSTLKFISVTFLTSLHLLGCLCDLFVNSYNKFCYHILIQSNL